MIGKRNMSNRQALLLLLKLLSFSGYLYFDTSFFPRNLTLMFSRYALENMKRWVKMIRVIGGLCFVTLLGIAYISTTSTPAMAFDITNNDVIVFLHIQKTGGTTFGRHLVRDLNLETPCICPRKRKRCDCFRPNTVNDQWLFSRYSTGWKCGLHADWTELTDCVESALDEFEGSAKKRRYFFITVLRDPIHRYLSEFRHVQRGATWKSARHWCGGQEFTSLPHCYKGSNWTGVELDEFMDCPYNLAHNRQTRMLADLTLAGCYTGFNSTEDRLERDRILLQSAKHNLANMAFFGLTEQQSISQYIFEQTFQLDFANSFDQANATLSAQAIAELTPSQLERVRQLNSLDTELLAFARKLMHERFEELKRRDLYFRQHWLRILRPFKSESPDDNSLV
uniref:Heparan-sulfate 6-O-sulfotransferase n=1 Tax=Scapholeberis mucronata TaxID=202097 RepID=A0A4Y7NMR6_9CRUS|nr:EOG090X0E58 [Scapholeberis mucronata]SVE93896.1 EOG090X0E58 [Scapholeberis mucronata]